MAPTREQQEYVEDICRVLNIDFPICSKEFVKEIYQNFIKINENEYKYALSEAAPEPSLYTIGHDIF